MGNSKQRLFKDEANALCHRNETTIGTAIVNHPGTNLHSTTHLSMQTKPEELQAFMYIVIVLLFYAMCIILLMVQYITRENEDAELNRYFTAFVRRDRYNCKVLENNKRRQEVLLTTNYIRAWEHCQRSRLQGIKETSV